MKYLLIVLFSVAAYSQEAISADLLKRKADSLIGQRMGNRLLKYVKVDAEASILYFDDNGTDVQLNLNQQIKSGMTFRGSALYYIFDYTPIKGIKCEFYAFIGRELLLNKELDLNCIPAFVIAGEPSNFITKEQAIAVAKEKFQDKGIYVKEPVLKYDFFKESYIYTVYNVIKEEKNKKKETIGLSLEVVTLYATSGSFIDRSHEYSGQIIDN